MTVTAVLITWRRQSNLSKIVDHLSQQSFISEILIRDNSKLENVINWGRYLLAEEAINHTIYTQDDDVIVNNIEEIYKKFISQPDRIAHGLGPTHFENQGNSFIEEPQHGIKTKMCMMGWGGFFDSDWIPILRDYMRSSLCASQEDRQLFYRETDRIFSILLNKPHNSVLADLTHLEGQDAPYALWRQPDHIHKHYTAVQKALEYLRYTRWQQSR